LDGQEQDVRDRLAATTTGHGATWLVTHEGGVVGVVTLSNIVRGVSQSAQLGYWTDHAHTGRGLATVAVETACRAAAGWGLHRVEAGTLLDNGASQGVLLRCGFTPIGVAAGYLFIAGHWQDHRLFQRILSTEAPR
jgi:ribosomal-protein-alanine N-acetyltransferase